MITSSKNETIKAVARLKRTRERKQTGLILIEGPNGFEAVLAAQMQPTIILATEDDRHTLDRLADRPTTKVHLVTRHVLESVSDTTHPQSPVIVVPRPVPTAVRLHNTVVLVDVNDPGNAGTIVRTAAALGWDVGYTPRCVDMWGPKTLRASAGAHFRTYLAEIDLEDERDPLEGFTVVATVVDGGEASIDSPGPYALLVGNEPRGLDRKHAADASHRLTIPMAGETESLNVAVASAIAMYALGGIDDGQEGIG